MGTLKEEHARVDELYAKYIRTGVTGEYFPKEREEARIELEKIKKTSYWISVRYHAGWVISPKAWPGKPEKDTRELDGELDFWLVELKHRLGGSRAREALDDALSLRGCGRGVVLNDLLESCYRNSPDPLIKEMAGRATGQYELRDWIRNHPIQAGLATAAYAGVFGTLAYMLYQVFTAVD